MSFNFTCFFLANPNKEPIQQVRKLLSIPFFCRTSKIYLHTLIINQPVLVITHMSLDFVACKFSISSLRDARVGITRISQANYYARFSVSYPTGSITMKNAIVQWNALSESVAGLPSLDALKAAIGRLQHSRP